MGEKRWASPPRGVNNEDLLGGVRVLELLHAGQHNLDLLLEAVYGLHLSLRDGLASSQTTCGLVFALPTDL
eukprot:5279931-Amphidinium_carterae.1